MAREAPEPAIAPLTARVERLKEWRRPCARDVRRGHGPAPET
jgi:hypothetical protein